ncbi:uncharacterized protein C1orf198 homolog [Gouania willdenowi]|uniref:DUF4706 domain-containing protein n=1 Tax=Gouania willdenowi TaxID=441366 RepID=A0A8C5DD13_GOUWI|nr:uncharacterized protein C1orf198 homolog [Gouania willdenowi]
MAATTVAGPDAHRMEAVKLEYFSSINSMARKIMQEREKIKAEHGPSWERMTPQQQDSAIDNCLMDPHIRARYAMHRVEREEVVCYPKLMLHTGQKIVHFGEEDLTWQDEHSAPFSWETKSQLEFSLMPGSADQSLSSSQAEQKSSAKAPVPSQHGKNTAGTKASGGEGRRPDEESSFWKISAERSRLVGEQADFHHLTPSQIKSLEKGEKPLPSYLRQESSKEAELPESLPHPPPPAKPIKQRAPKPPAPQPPVAVSAVPPASISISSNPAPPVSVAPSVGGWERSQSTLPSVSNTPDEVFSSSLMSKHVERSSGADKEKKKKEEKEASPGVDASPAFSQFNTSNNILKTGFDFLDNW